MDDLQLVKVSDGRIFSGRQGLGLKLVDELGGERQAITWLEQNKNVTKDLPVHEWKRRSEAERLGLWSASALAAKLVGLDALSQSLLRLERHGGRLDGLLALWQPALEK